MLYLITQTVSIIVNLNSRVFIIIIHIYLSSIALPDNTESKYNIANLYSRVTIIIIILHNYLSSIAIPDNTDGKYHRQLVLSCIVLIFFIIIYLSSLLYLITQHVSIIVNLYSSVTIIMILHNFLSSIAIPDNTDSKYHCQFILSCIYYYSYLSLVNCFT